MLPHFREDYCDDDYKTSCSNLGQIRLSRGNLSEKVRFLSVPSDRLRWMYQSQWAIYRWGELLSCLCSFDPQLFLCL